MTRFERYKAHVDQWKDCTLCPLHCNRRRTVFCRGKIPAEILFIGEAPGPSEESLGRPFVGPAGKVLDRIIEEAWVKVVDEGLAFTEVSDKELRFCISNSVLCYPGRDPNGKISAPKKDAVKACNPRLLEFVEIVNPKIIIRLGNVAKSATKELVGKYTIRSMVHPSHILHQEENPQMQHIMFERCVHQLAKWIGEVYAHN